MNNTVYEWVLQSTFHVSAREGSSHSAKADLCNLIRPGDEVLDLCYSVSFWLESQGTKVTGMDFAPYMLSLARQEAKQRISTIEFIEEDIFEQAFGHKKYSLILCFDSIFDFPASYFAILGRKIANAQKPGGRFVVKYVDYKNFLDNNLLLEGKYQDEPEVITFQIKEFLPDESAFVNTIRNKTREQEYDRKVYIYTSPIIQLFKGRVLELERHAVLDDQEILIFPSNQIKPIGQIA